MWNIRLILLFNLILLINLHTCRAGLYDYLRAAQVQNDEATRPESFTVKQLQQAVSFAEESFERLKGLETSISSSAVKLSNNTSSYAQLLESLPNDRTKEIDKTAQIILRGSKYLLNNDCRSVGYDEKQCVDLISTYQLPEGDLLNKCRQMQAQFNSNTYRRLLPANYADRLHQINEQLPPPKNVSDIFYEQTRPEPQLINTDLATFEGLLDEERNIAVAQWAQFIEHDLVKTVFQTMSNDNPIECCTDDATLPAPRYRHPACSPLNIEVSSDEYTQLPSCLNYVRSALGVNEDCKFGPAQQLNQASHLLDLSQLYGISNDGENELRSFKNGEMKISNDPSQPLLPLSSDNDENDLNLCMHNSTSDGVCYQSGDSRVNMNPYMTTLYTMFLRSHNRIARRIHKMKSTWKDERIFDTAKRINTAIYQKILFSEWLPIILGQQRTDAINNEEILVKSSSLRKGVSNEFATAGIRFYYSMMPGDLRTTRDVRYFVRQNNLVIRPVTENHILKLKDEFYKPRDLSENDEMENIVHAILTQRAMAMDSGYVADVVKHFYRFKNSEQKTVGTDVLALDILRGRDHGLSGYIKYLELCTNDTISNWDDLKRYISIQDLHRLQSIYNSINHIDLIIGAIAERPNPGATVGPTLSCLIGEQLSNTRRSDPFFYTLLSDPMIRDIVDDYSGAKLMCHTTQLPSVPKNIFFVPSEKNPLVSCANFSP